MAIPGDIRKRGFRKWYEGQLLVSHSHLVLLLLCGLAALGAVEAFGQQGSQKLLMALALALSAAIGAWAIRRYLTFLMRAEAIANQATCPACKAYGRWRVEAEEPPDAEGGGAITACCRGCGHHWRIEW